MKHLILSLTIGLIVSGCSSSATPEISELHRTHLAFDGYDIKTDISPKISVDSLLMTAIQADIKTISDQFTTLAENTESEYRNDWLLTMSFDPVFESTEAISVLGQVAEYTGGAHGNTVFYTYTYDKSANALVGFTDLFNPDQDASSVIQFVRQTLKDKLGRDANLDWINDGTTFSAENYQNFTLTHGEPGEPDGLSFHFPAYHVAPYAAGPQTVFVPFSILHPILTTAYQQP